MKEGKKEDYDLEVGIKLLDGVQAPKMGSEEAACFDVYAGKVTKVNEFYYKVKLNITTDIPKGWKGILDPRSGITDTGWGLCNSRGVIDSDFLGNWQARFRPYQAQTKHRIVEIKEGDCEEMLEALIEIPKYPFPYKEGDRIAQISFDKVNNVVFKFVDKIDKSTKRGEGGHNSTGLK